MIQRKINARPRKKLNFLTPEFALWWSYFKLPMGELLENNRGKAFIFGYIHYFVFASLASLGAGLGLLADYMGVPDNRLLAKTALVTIANASGMYLLLVSFINSVLFKQHTESFKLLGIALFAPAIPMALFILDVPMKYAILSAVIAPILYTYCLNTDKTAND